MFLAHVQMLGNEASAIGQKRARDEKVSHPPLPKRKDPGLQN
jgi:hypothetical protein